MVRARKLSGISLCVYMCFCMWSFPPVAKSPKSNPSHTVQVCRRSFECDLFPPAFTRLFHFSDGFSLLVSWLALVWSGLVWGGLVSIPSAPLLATRWRRGVAFIQFLYKFYHFCVKSIRWNCLSGAKVETVMLIFKFFFFFKFIYLFIFLGAQFGLLWRWQRFLFTFAIILLFFLLIVIVRIVNQSH